jgi:hypothetical protein
MVSGVIILMYLASRLLALALLSGHMRLDQAPVKRLSGEGLSDWFSQSVGLLVYLGGYAACARSVEVPDWVAGNGLTLPTFHWGHDAYAQFPFGV